MSDETENLKLPYIMPNQAQKHVTHNEAIKVLDALVQLSVVSASESQPPETPAPGARYIVASGAAGKWLGWDMSVACFIDGLWTRFVPQEGWQAWVRDRAEMLIWSGSAWISISNGSVSGGSVQNVSKLGVGTSATEATRFAAQLNSALWTAASEAEGGDGHLRVTLNKEGAENDAALVLQDGYSSRALLGLLGSDDFTLQVSPDGASFLQALTVGAETGNIAIGAGADANNRLLVSGQNSLFTNAGSLNVVMNKGADGDDLSFTLQSGFTTRALLGLLGGRDFSIKVGDDYKTALVIDSATGAISQPRAPSFSATSANDQAVAANTWTTIVFENLRHNVAEHFDPATGIFTAPVDGSYLFGATVIYKQDSDSPDQMLLGFAIDGGNPANDRKARTEGELTTQKTELSLVSNIYLQKSQTVQPMVRLSGGGGSALGANTGTFWGMIGG